MITINKPKPKGEFPKAEEVRELMRKSIEEDKVRKSKERDYAIRQFLSKAGAESLIKLQNTITRAAEKGLTCIPINLYPEACWYLESLGYRVEKHYGSEWLVSWGDEGEGLDTEETK